MKTLMISTDWKIFEPESAVRARMINYSRSDSLLIVILGINRKLQTSGNLRFMGLTRWQAFFWRPPERFDLVTSQDPFETGVIARRLARIVGAKLELQIHTDIGNNYFQHESFKNRVRYFLAKRLLPKADHIRVVSNRVRLYLVEKLKVENSKIEVRPIFIDVEKIKNSPITLNLHQKYPQFDKIILMASRLTREKNIGLAIEAIRDANLRIHTNDTNKKILLLIVGSGPEEKKLKLLASSFQLSENIIFENWVDQETLYSYYKTCDLFLVTSFYEGYGMTLVEAQAAGCKIVATDVGVAREIGAHIVSINDPQAVAENIVKLLA